MNCDWVAENLSAYLDGQAGADERLRIDAHCQHCSACRQLISQMVAMGELMRRAEPQAHEDANADAIWQQVAARLDSATVEPHSLQSPRRRWIYATLASVASITLLVVAARYGSQQDHHDNHQHGDLTVDFQQVVQIARTEPESALATLAAKYQGRVLDEKSASEFLGYQPVLFRAVPDGFKRVSTHGLNMPCCKCSATICQRDDGTALIVFEHKDEQPIWFGDSPAIERQCSGKSCKIVESAGQLAVSWKSDDRQLTMIGANDMAEVNQWVALLQR